MESRVGVLSAWCVDRAAGVRCVRQCTPRKAELAVRDDNNVLQHVSLACSANAQRPY
jgi:hypothetical protein